MERITARRLAADVSTLYAELLEQLTVLDAGRSIGQAAGSFVTKTVKGQIYYYFQHSSPGGTLKQTSSGARARSWTSWRRGFPSSAATPRPTGRAWSGYARFALHKLLVTRSRPAVFQTKGDKDLRQAAFLIEVLREDRPGDLDLALEALRARGREWNETFDEGLLLLAKRAPEAASHIRALHRPRSRSRS